MTPLLTLLIQYALGLVPSTCLLSAERPWWSRQVGPPITRGRGRRLGLQGLGGQKRARTIANKPISITPPPEVKLLRIQLGPEQGTT